MSSLYRNRYRIESTRLKGFDYSAPGKYFITICTKNKIPFFGKICNRKIALSETGIIARNSWLAIPSHFPFALLDEFIIMPDHIHGIIIIESSVQTPKLGVSTTPKLGVSTTPKLGVSTTPKLGVSTTPKLAIATGKKTENQHWKPNSIGSIINQFKRICTIITKTKGLDFSWQPRYYDHIIRSDEELYRIRNYIVNNPRKFTEK